MRESRRLTTTIRALIFAFLMLSACANPDAESEIRDLIADLERALEARNMRDFRHFVADSYRDSHGNDRQRLIDAIRAFFLTNSRIEAIVRVDSVLLSGSDSAEVVLQIALLRDAGGEPVLGFDADLRTVELELLRIDGWQLIGAAW